MTIEMPTPARRIARLLLPVLLALDAAQASAGIDRWTPFGPGGTGVADVVVDPRSPATLWIAAGTIYKSENGGATFRLSADGLDGHFIQRLAIDPGEPDILYGTVLDDGPSGIYRSQDGGAHWTHIAADLSFIWSLAVAPGPPGAPGVVFVGTDVRLYRSVDGGASFEAVISLNSADLFVAVTPDFRNPGTVYTATLFGRAKSIDFGVTWTDLVEDPGHFPPFIHDLAVAPGDPQTLYETGDGANVGETWRSRDGGATWQGPFPFRGDVLAVDPEDSNTVYGGSLLGLFVSHDGGETFTEATRGVPPLSVEVTGYYGVTAIKTDPARPGYALAATAQGLFATENRGRTWHPAPLGGLLFNPVGNFRIDPYGPAHWILTSLGSYYESHDRGRTFTLFAGPLRDVQIDSIEFDPFVRNRLWALARRFASLELYFSKNGGATWIRHGEAPDVGALLLPAPRVLMISGNRIYRSGDAGHTWRNVHSFVGQPLVQDPRSPRTIFDAAGRYRSDDAGRTWRLWHSASVFQTIGFDPFRPGTIHLVQGNDLTVTRDGGETFQVVGHLPFKNAPHLVLELLFDRQRHGVLYAATFADGILRSQDGGATWEPLNDGLPDPRGKVTNLIQDPASGRRFYIAPDSGGLYRADFRWNRFQDGGTARQPLRHPRELPSRCLAGPRSGAAIQGPGDAPDRRALLRRYRRVALARPRPRLRCVCGAPRRRSPAGTLPKHPGRLA